MSWLNVADFVPCTEAEGPGRRAALWVQGCAERCPSCCNPRFLEIRERELLPAAIMVDRIVRAQAAFDLEGVTFLGGEPMLQARGLAEVARGCRARGLSVMTFSGYTREELATAPIAGVDELLAATDVLVDGRYVAEAPELARNWVGSSNQRFHYLTSRYDPSIETDPRWARSVEVQVGVDGTVRVNGWPTRVRRAGGSGGPTG